MTITDRKVCEWCITDPAQCERDGCACECHAVSVLTKTIPGGAGMWDEAIPIGRVGDEVLAPGVIEKIVPAVPEFPWPCIVVRFGDVSVVFPAHKVTKPGVTDREKRDTDG